MADSPQTVEELWADYDATEARLTETLSVRMLALGGVRPAMRVLDLPTGRGEPAVRAVLAVGPRGQVVGVDLSPTMLAMVGYWNMSREVLARVTGAPMGPLDRAAAMFRYASPDALPSDLRAEGFTVEHTEDFELAVMEAATAAEAIAWVRAFAMGRLLDGVTPEIQRSWEAEMTRELESRRENDGMIRLGGITRIVVAKAG